MTFAVALCGCLTAGACAASTPRAAVPRMSASGGVLTLPDSASATGRAVPLVIGTTNGDLRSFDWRNTELPGQFCEVPGLLSFKDAQALGTSNRWGAVHFYAANILYGDLGSDEPSVAAVSVGCDNGGGTADGELAFAAILLTSAAKQIEVLGTITPQMNPIGEHATLLSKIQIADGKVVVDEDWYTPSDETCCPTGRATTVWTWANGELTAGTPDITN